MKMGTHSTKIIHHDWVKILLPHCIPVSFFNFRNLELVSFENLQHFISYKTFFLEISHQHFICLFKSGYTKFIQRSNQFFLLVFVSNNFNLYMIHNIKIKKAVWWT